MTVVNEAGLYDLLLAMEPKKAKGVSQNSELIEARIRLLDEFKRWIAHDVLPCIRKYGCYITPKKLREIENEPNVLYRIALLLAAKREAVPAWTLPDQDVKDVSGRILEKNRPAYEYLTDAAVDEDVIEKLQISENEPK